MSNIEAYGRHVPQTHVRPVVPVAHEPHISRADRVDDGLAAGARRRSFWLAARARGAADGRHRGTRVAGSDAFGELRSMRSAPPGYAAFTADRRSVFLAALEQCEQLLRTAGTLGYATRALNLFYGLSQAGRAVMAAWAPPELGAERAWQLSGHGIAFEDQRVSLVKRALVGKPGRTIAEGAEKSPRSFVGLCDVLGCATLQHPVGFVELWAALPEATGRPAPGDEFRPGPVQIQLPTYRPEDALITVAAVQAWVHNFALEPLDRWLRDDPDNFNQRLAMYLALHYPTLPTPSQSAMPRPWATDKFGRRLSIQLTWNLGANMEAREADWHLTIEQGHYRGTSFAFPAFEGGQQLHPMMIWWAVLYALSMFARYEPREWIELLDVDKSHWATPLEHLLDEAVSALPEIIADVLRLSPTMG